MKQSSTYIIPRIEVFQSIEDPNLKLGLFDYGLFDDENINRLEDVFIYPRTIVIAEPGYGKTRLLKELISRASKRKIKSIYIDLKKPLELADLENHKNNRIVYYCFDALDEVEPEKFSTVVETIKIFIKKNPSFTFFIASRWHFFKKNQELFLDSNFIYAHISPFSLKKVHIYLKEKDLTEEDIKKIINLLNFKHKNIIIQTPRYLEFLVSYVKEKGLSEVGALTRADLFEYFIYTKLEQEDKKLNTQKREIIKRVLEKIALTMEISQKNIITKDELMTFFDDIHSDLKANFLQQVRIETLYDKTLLKDNIDTIEFDNPEFQEYLAAKEVKRLGHPLQTVFDLCVDLDMRQIYPSWFNTLSFIIELDPTLLKSILDFTNNKNEGYIQDEEYHRLLTRINLTFVPKEDQKAIFNQIFIYYQTVLHWIDWEIAENLAAYFDLSQIDLLKFYLNKTKFSSDIERFVQLGNLVQIVGFLIEHNIFIQSDRDLWKSKIIQFANDKNKNGVLQRNALFALEKFKDDSILTELVDVWDNDDELVRDRFLEFCISVNPNHNISIKYFIKGIKQHLYHSRLGLYSITDSQAISTLLKYFVDDELFLRQFLDLGRIFKEKDKQIIENIKAVWNEDLKNQLELLCQKVFSSDFYYYAENSNFVIYVALLLKENNKNYLFKLISQVRESPNLQRNLDTFLSLFVVILDKDQVEEFVNQLSKFNQGRRISLWTLQKIKFSKRLCSNEIYEEGRKCLEKEYKDSEEQWEKQSHNLTEDDQAYITFKQKLEPSSDRYMEDVFQFFVENYKRINKLITKIDKNRLVKLLTGSIFEKFNPLGQTITILKETSGKTTYTTNTWIRIFGDCILVAQILKIDVTKYRRKIVSYIPFAFHDHQKAIFELVKDIKPEEISDLLKTYSDKSSDLWRFNPNGLIEAAKKFQLIEAVPILREFIDQSEFSIHDKMAALETADSLRPDPQFLKNVFNKFNKTNTKLAEKANRILIEKHKNMEAIKWIFKQIKEKAFTFNEQKDAHIVGENERELHDKEFASPLLSLKDRIFQNQYIDLLDYSFGIIKKNKMYYSYAQYIWQIIYSYFNNLKEERSYEPLKKLEDYLSKSSSKKGINWFTEKYKELKRSYLIYIGRPVFFEQCIQMYNKIKTRQYLDISTSRELLGKLKEVIQIDLENWVIGEGNKLLDNDNEVTTQKLIKTQLENGFLRKGLRPQEITIIREPQLQDDKRIDFLLFYGFIGPIIIELKLSKSSDLSGKLATKKSYKNLQAYMTNYKADYGIFLVIENKKRSKKGESWKKQLNKIIDAYQRINNVEVIGIPSS